MNYLQVTAIGGVPASGKTRLMRSAIAFLNKRKALGFAFKSGLIHGLQFPAARAVIVGKYEGSEVFAGTDKLSMAAQPDFLRWIRNEVRPEGYFRHILFEGDRLFNASLFEALKADGIELRIIILDVDSETLSNRYTERDSNQPEKFLKAKRTKTENIMRKFPNHEYWTNGSVSELIYNTNRIMDFYTEPF